MQKHSWMRKLLPPKQIMYCISSDGGAGGKENIYSHKFRRGFRFAYKQRLCRKVCFEETFSKYYSYETSGEKCIDLFVVRENKSTHSAIHVWKFLFEILNENLSFWFIFECNIAVEHSQELFRFELPSMTRREIGCETFMAISVGTSSKHPALEKFSN